MATQLTTAVRCRQFTFRIWRAFGPYNVAIDVEMLLVRSSDPIFPCKVYGADGAGGLFYNILRRVYYAALARLPVAGWAEHGHPRNTYGVCLLHITHSLPVFSFEPFL